MLHVLMISSLEDSLQMAEAMKARAFGSGPRSVYRRDLFRPRDGLCLAGSIFSLGATVYCIINDLGSYTFFPQLGSLFSNAATLPALAAVLSGLTLPALLELGVELVPLYKVENLTYYYPDAPQPAPSKHQYGY